MVDREFSPTDKTTLNWARLKVGWLVHISRINSPTILNRISWWRGFYRLHPAQINPKREI